MTGTNNVLNGLSVCIILSERIHGIWVPYSHANDTSHPTYNLRSPHAHWEYSGSHIMLLFLDFWLFVLPITFRKYFIYITGSLIRYAALAIYSRYLALNFLSIRWKRLNHGSLNSFPCIEIRFHIIPLSQRPCELTRQMFFSVNLNNNVSELQY